MPIVPRATSGSLCCAIEAVELSATRSQTSCARRSGRPRSLMKDRAAFAPLTSKRLANAGSEPNVVQDGADRHHLVVALNRLHLPDPCGEQPGSHGVVEEIGL